MRVLVTGATGIVGRHVLERLLERGDNVRALVLPETLERMRYRDQLEVVLGSLADRDVLDRAVKDAEVIYHLAELRPAHGKMSQDIFETNVKGTENLQRACAKAKGVRRFVFNSSVQVYSPHPLPHMWPIVEETERRAHGSPEMKEYGQSKIEAEDLVQDYHRRHGLEYVILRPTRLYGPGERSVEQFITQMINAPRQALAGGAQWGGMQWVYVTDLADAIVLAGTQPAAANNIFTIAGGELMTAQSIAVALRQIMRPTHMQPAHQRLNGRQFQGRQPQGRTRLMRYDLSKAQELLGYTPRVNLQDGLEKVLMAMDHQSVFGLAQARPLPQGGLRRASAGQRSLGRNGNEKGARVSKRDERDEAQVNYGRARRRPLRNG